MDFEAPEYYPFGKHREQDLINRQFMTRTAEMPQTITFDLGLEFIERNKNADDWFLQLETFDPYAPRRRRRRNDLRRWQSRASQQA